MHQLTCFSLMLLVLLRYMEGKKTLLLLLLHLVTFSGLTCFSILKVKAKSQIEVNNNIAT